MIRFLLNIQAALLVALPISSASAQSTERVFKGRVAGARVTMKLRRSGNQLSGAYSYDRIGRDIALKGSIDSAGNVKLQEFGDGGAQATAAFTGKLEEPGNLLTAWLDGEWAKTGGGKQETFWVKEVNAEPGINVTAQGIKDEKLKTLSIDVVWPEFSGIANPNAAKFNARVKGDVLKRVAEFRASYAKDHGKGESWGYTEDYDVALVTNQLISVLLTAGPYSGGAHPGYGAESYNYDLVAGKFLTLADLFRPGSNYLQVISKHCAGDLLKREGLDDQNAIREGVAPKAENFQVWNLTRRGLVIVIEPYRVGPYAAGPQFVTVPFGVLKPVIRPDGPLASLVK
ncbi:MAG TPA: DUF3298 and DUF4163 domain-containing protein [Blastocatellia bacterium]|nr:DUF3298 and DUF4163 domain-containing protein [Blastocatellia bacterium]